MKKLTLDPDTLRVESFATDSRMSGGGTVRGHDSNSMENGCTWGCPATVDATCISCMPCHPATLPGGYRGDVVPRQRLHSRELIPPRSGAHLPRCPGDERRADAARRGSSRRVRRKQTSDVPPDQSVAVQPRPFRMSRTRGWKPESVRRAPGDLVSAREVQSLAARRGAVIMSESNTAVVLRFGRVGERDLLGDGAIVTRLGHASGTLRANPCTSAHVDFRFSLRPA